MYAVGSKVVHPCHGAGTIVRIKETRIGKSANSYYVIATVAGSMQVMVPVARAEGVGVRDVGQQRNLRRMLVRCCIPPEEDEIEKDFRARQAVMREQLKSGRFEEVISSVRILYFLNARRPLGITDRQMLDDGKKLLAGELALASGLEMDAAIQEIELGLAEMLVSKDE